MIRYAVCVGPGQRFDRVTRPSLEEHRGADSDVVLLHDQTSLGVAYNRVLDEAATRPDVDAVVFLHDDVRIVDAELDAKLRAAVGGSDVAVVGVIGGRQPTEMSWASGSAVVGRVVEVHEWNESRREIDGDPHTGTNDVDTVDGVFMAFSPWAVANLRFDVRHFPGFDGYDADVCAQARHLGKRVLTAAIALEHVNTRPDGVVHRRSTNHRAVLMWRAKWRTDEPRWRRVGWNLRARTLRAEYRLRRIPWRG